jgi:dolichyl-phosphate-mannose--protein O-mannosyl transferase
MKSSDGVGATAEPAQIALPQLNVNVFQIALVTVLVLAFLTRFVRLGTPDEFYFDETYFPRTGQEIYRGDPKAWEFYGHENTHPPLSKLFMAGGMAVFEVADSAVPAIVPGSGGVDNPWAWRFFGALAGFGAVVFMYLLAKKLFDSEIAGLAGAFLLTCDGLAFAQSRIATPDTYVLFFTLGALYFLVSERFLFSGVFFGAAVACKWIAALAGIPIVLFLAWLLITRLREARDGGEIKWFEIVLPGGLGILYAGLILFVYKYLGTHPDTTFSITQGIVEIVAFMMIITGILCAFAGVFGLIVERSQFGSVELSAVGKVLLEVALVFGVFFILVPGFIYFMTYWPFLLNPPSAQAMGDADWHGLGQVIRQNRLAFDFHSSLDQPHPYASTWDEWPIMARPIYFYESADPDIEKIYSMGNPVIFWAGLPALAFVLWQSLAFVRARISVSGLLTVGGRLQRRQALLLWVVLGYLALWLPMAPTSRVLFLYHYLPALSFVILALSYTLHWLWHRPEEWGRYAAITFLALVAGMFIFLYPHLAAVPVPGWLDELYYPFDQDHRLHNPLFDWQ